jgi:hypothetical protein
MKLNPLFRTGVLVLTIAVLATPDLDAATVRFDDANRGSTNTFQVGLVTISAGTMPLSGQPATVAGFGLGTAGPVGPSYSLDQQLHYSAGQSTPDSILKENAITFQIDPAYTFTSMTIVPYLSISNLATPPCSFTIEYDVTGTTGPWVDQYFRSATPADYGQPLTLNLAPLPGMDIYRFDLQVTTGLAGGEAVNFYQYRLNHLSEDQTFQFGFTIQSLDYTIVPEPGVAVLLLAGAAGWVCCRGARPHAGAQG